MSPPTSSSKPSSHSKPVTPPAGASELGRDSIVSKGLGGQNIVKEATSGIFGRGGDLNLLKGSLLTKPDGSLSLTKAGAAGVGVLSLIQNSKTPEEAGNALVAATGDSDDYERGVQLFSSLPQGIFDIPTEYRLPSANGGLMRTNYAIGSDDEGEPIKPDPTKPINPFGPKPTGPVLPDKKMAGFDLLEYQEEFETVFPEIREKR